MCRHSRLGAWLRWRVDSRGCCEGRWRHRPPRADLSPEQVIKRPKPLMVKAESRCSHDPFGQGFLERIAKCPKKTRDARLTKIEKALALAVPRFKQLQFAQDESTGRPHLEALYEHHRPHAGWQREEQFSDGTLRLIGLLWTLLDGESLLLLEEPELSLHNAIVEQIPRMIQHIQRSTKRRRQMVISSHSEAMLSNPGIDGRGVLVLEPGAEGTLIRILDDGENSGLKAGLSIAEVVLPKTRPAAAEQLGLW